MHNRQVSVINHENFALFSKNCTTVSSSDEKKESFLDFVLKHSVFLEKTPPQLKRAMPMITSFPKYDEILCCRDQWLAL